MQHALTILGLGIASALNGMVGSARAAEAGGESAIVQRTAVPRVVLVGSPGMEDLMVHFMAELDSLRLEVARAPDEEAAPDLLELASLARAHRARVSVRVSRAGPAVDLWLVNAETHELVYHRVVGDGDDAVLVLRSLEILRGALVDLGMAQDARRTPQPPTRVPPPAPPGERRRAARGLWWVGFSGGLLWPRAEIRLGTAALSLRRDFDSRFALRAELSLPLNAWNVSGEGGRAAIRLGSATLSGHVSPWGDRTFSPGLGLGVGALAVDVRGEAETGYDAESSFNTAFFAQGRAEFLLKLGERFRMRAELAAGFSTPQPVLLFGRKRDENWLNPLLNSTLGIEIALR